MFVCWLLLSPVPPGFCPPCELSEFCVVESCPGWLSPDSVLLPLEELPSSPLSEGVVCTVSFLFSTSPVLVCNCSPFELPSPCDGWFCAPGSCPCGGCSDGSPDSFGFWFPCEGVVFSFLLTSNVFVIGLYLSENKFLFPSLL